MNGFLEWAYLVEIPSAIIFVGLAIWLGWRIVRRVRISPKHPFTDSVHPEERLKAVRSYLQPDRPPDFQIWAIIVLGLGWLQGASVGFSQVGGIGYSPQSAHGYEYYASFSFWGQTVRQQGSFEEITSLAGTVGQFYACYYSLWGFGIASVFCILAWVIRWLACFAYLGVTEDA